MSPRRRRLCGSMEVHERLSEVYASFRDNQNRIESFTARSIDSGLAQRVTRQRLWLEAVEGTLSRIENKVFIDEGVGKGAVPVLPIPMPGVHAGEKQ